MKEVAYCCRDVSYIPNLRSPFSRIICLGYYDGPTSGVLECGQCLTAYQFELRTWDEEQDMRIFSLASLPPNSFDKLINILSKFDTPSWPIWLPRWIFDSQETEINVEQEIKDILDQASFPNLIIASQDLKRDIEVARRII